MVMKLRAIACLGCYLARSDHGRQRSEVGSRQLIDLRSTDDLAPKPRLRIWGFVATVENDGPPASCATQRHLRGHRAGLLAGIDCSPSMDCLHLCPCNACESHGVASLAPEREQCNQHQRHPGESVRVDEISRSYLSSSCASTAAARRLCRMPLRLPLEAYTPSVAGVGLGTYGTAL